MLDAAAKQMIETFPLGFVATVTKEGRPAVSPKGTFLVLDDACAGFGNIRSPGTLRNLAAAPYAEVNFIDPFARKALRLRGAARILPEGSEEFGALIGHWRAKWGDLAARITDLILIDIEAARHMTTPPYDDGMTEAEMIAAYKVKFAEIYP
ncbi:pyridoxamine 5'-phosphate oxidase family protein [Roseovarius aquimarinus]|uniref:Pyridoxamine 5'-phosphate oxidase family protein n=1 Tax=Roseovarius aquimarinus TaxID=1229156 RepID=A0ABW7IBT8_9RHOB